MPTYLYRCDLHGDWEEWRSINDESRPPCPECGVQPDIVMVPPLISVDALPNKAPDAKRTMAMDRAWDKDLPAYKALRKNGLQPRGIDGCHQIEAEAKDRLEVEMGKKIEPKHLSRVKDAASELKENERKGVAKEVGDTRKEMLKPKPVAVAT